MLDAYALMALPFARQILLAMAKKHAIFMGSWRESAHCPLVVTRMQHCMGSQDQVLETYRTLLPKADQSSQRLMEEASGYLYYFHFSHPLDKGIRHLVLSFVISSCEMEMCQSNT
jgi:hypothetical protein